MYDIKFFKDKNGKEPIREYIENLSSKTSKDARIKFEKIVQYLEVLEKNGKSAGEPYVKPLEDGIWEIRPLSDRILFAAWNGKEIILLHHFIKKTQKTPRKEIIKAKKNLKLYIEGEKLK